MLQLILNYKSLHQNHTLHLEGFQLLIFLLFIRRIKRIELVIKLINKIISIILFIIPLFFNLMTYHGMTSDELKSTFAFFHPTSEQISTETKTMQGSFLEQMPIRLEYAIQFQTLFFLIERFVSELCKKVFYSSNDL